jgi:hypothetical protein
MKSFVLKDGSGTKPPGKGDGRNAERNFRGEKISNETHASRTDPDAHLFRKAKGKEAKLCHMGHIMTENRHGLIIDARVTEASGTAEPMTALDMVEDNAGPEQQSEPKNTMTPPSLLPVVASADVCRTLPRTIAIAARRSTRGPRVILATRSAS